jgi:hypothetical protein
VDVALRLLADVKTVDGDLRQFAAGDRARTDGVHRVRTAFPDHVLAELRSRARNRVRQFARTKSRAPNQAHEIARTNASKKTRFEKRARVPTPVPTRAAQNWLDRRRART